MRDKKTVAVIGAGIVGVSTAIWCLRDGHDVILIDKKGPGEGTSHGNGGVLASNGVIPVSVPGLWKKAPGMLFSPDQPLFLKWSYLPRLLPWLVPFLRRATHKDVEKTARALATIVTDAVDQHKALAAGTKAERLIHYGIYAFLYTSRAACEADEWTHAIRREHGAQVEFRDRERLLQDDPHLGDHYQYAACHMDHGWISDPGAYVAALAAHYRENGGAFLQGEVDDIRPVTDAAEVTVAGQTIRFDQVVLAGGAWSAKLAKRLGHNPMLESERGYHMVLKDPAHRPPFAYMLTDAKFVATPMDGGLRCAGQVEFGGLDAGPSEKPFNVVQTRIRQLYPDLTWSGEERWLGHRPSTVDSLPFIGPSPKARRIHFAFGAQHIGLTTGPKTGRLIADMIAGRRPNSDLSPFEVDRFD